MRICDLVQFHSPISGGVKRYIRDKCRYFATRPEYEHLVIVPGRRPWETVQGRTRFVEVPSPLLPGSKSYRLLWRRGRIDEILRNFRPDIIEVGDPYVTGWLGRRLARRLGVPVLSFYHSDYPRASHRTLRKYLGPTLARPINTFIVRYLTSLYRGMDALVTATAMFQRFWTLAGLPQVVRIPLGVDGSVFQPVEGAGPACRREWGLPPESRIVLFVGRMAREKNIRFLLQLARRLNQADPRTYLVLIGDGELGSYLARIENDSPWLRWVRYIDQPQTLARAYTASDVLVHAGMAETFGLSALEAQACGTATVAARSSGLDETLFPPCGSILVEDLQPDLFFDACRQVLAAPPTFAQRQERHLFTVEAYPHERTFSDLLDLYRNLIAGRGARLSQGTPPPFPSGPLPLHPPEEPSPVFPSSHPSP